MIKRVVQGFMHHLKWMANLVLALVRMGIQNIACPELDQMGERYIFIGP